MSASARSTGFAPVKAAAASSPTMNSMGDWRRTYLGSGSPICVISRDIPAMRQLLPLQRFR